MLNDNLIFSNFLHRPMRSFISVSGIAVGVFLIISTIGLSEGTLRGNARREANTGAEIIVRGAGTFGLSGSEPFHLPVSETAEIAKIEGVKTAVPLGQNLDAAADSETGSRLIDGVNYDEYQEISGLQIIEGRKLALDGSEAIIDTAWQAQKKLKIGSTLKIYEKDFTIVGSYEPASGARIKIPLETMQKQLLGDTKYCTSILVKLDNPNEQEVMAARILQKFPQNQVILTRDFEELYMHAVPALGVFLNVVIGVAAFVGILVILLTMYTAVLERTRQIGILKSLGMSKFAIVGTIVKESLLICFFGFLLGVILTAALGFTLTRTTSSMQMAVEWKTILLTLIGGILSGAVGALYPAIHAARLDAVEALNYN